MTAEHLPSQNCFTKGPAQLVRAFCVNGRLFVAKSLHGIQLGGSRGGIESGNHADRDGEGNGSAHQPPRNRP